MFKDCKVMKCQYINGPIAWSLNEATHINKKCASKININYWSKIVCITATVRVTRRLTPNLRCKSVFKYDLSLKCRLFKRSLKQNDWQYQYHPVLCLLLTKRNFVSYIRVIFCENIRKETYMSNKPHLIFHI